GINTARNKQNSLTSPRHNRAAPCGCHPCSRKARAAPTATTITRYKANRQPARIPCGPTKTRRIPDGFSGDDTSGGEGFGSGNGEVLTSSIAELPRNNDQTW